MTAPPTRLSALAALAFLCLGASSGKLPAPGKSRTEIEGCLAKTRSRAPAPPAAKSQDDGNDVEVDTRAAGIVVTHNLQHACCLRGAAQTTVHAGVIELALTLSGEPCRCLCHSTVTTAIGLAPGTYRLRVIVKPHGKSWTAHESTVTVR